jgi:hypothetical protein
MTTNVVIKAPHGSADKALRVRTFATTSDGTPDLANQKGPAQLLADGADLSMHVYGGMAILVDEVALPKPQATETDGA